MSDNSKNNDPIEEIQGKYSENPIVKAIGYTLGSAIYWGLSPVGWIFGEDSYDRSIETVSKGLKSASSWCRSTAKYLGEKEQ